MKARTFQAKRRHLIVRLLVIIAVVHVTLFDLQVWRARYALWKARLSL